MPWPPLLAVGWDGFGGGCPGRVHAGEVFGAGGGGDVAGAVPVQCSGVVECRVPPGVVDGFVVPWAQGGEICRFDRPVVGPMSEVMDFESSSRTAWRCPSFCSSFTPE